jgi:hypothetical protein
MKVKKPTSIILKKAQIQIMEFKTSGCRGVQSPVSDPEITSHRLLWH